MWALTGARDGRIALLMAGVPAGTNLREAVSARQLRELYLEQGLTIAQIAGRLGLAATTIRRRLRELTIPARPRGPRASTSSTRDPVVWTPDLAYVVGLIATDGNLSKKPGRVAIMSNDTDLLDLVRQRLKLVTEIRPHRGGYGIRCHHLIWSDRRFYDWLISVGLTPAKSLTLGPLAIPDEHFTDFFRGCIDGDGSIVSYVDRYNTFKSPSYVYTRLYVSVASASARFIEWLQASAQRRQRGWSHRREPAKRPPPSLAPALCEARVFGGATVDLLHAGRGLSGPKAAHRYIVSRCLGGPADAKARSAGDSMSAQSRRVETGKRARLKTGCP